MRKIFTSFILAMVCTVMAMATPTYVDFDKIQRWVGTGDNRAALAVHWNDGVENSKTIVWGYRWDSNTTKTGADMVKEIAKADPAFYVLSMDGTAYDSAIGGLGYDLNGDNYFFVTDASDNVVYARNGVYTTGSYNFDSYNVVDPTDHWNSGWNKGYWSYYVAANTAAELGFSGVGAFGRKLTDGCVDAWIFASFSGGASTPYDENVDYGSPITGGYTKGAFVINEDWYGHRNSTVNYLGNDGTWTYEAISNIGCSACFGTFYGNRLYVTAKQAKDPGATVEGGRISVYDAGMLSLITQIPVIDANANPDARSFVGVTPSKGYVSTTKGIYVLDLDKLEITGYVTDADGNAISGECGNMVRLNDYVYAVTPNNGIAVIDPETDKMVSSIEGKFASIVMSKDGQLWASRKNNGGLSRLNLAEGTAENITLPDGIGNPATSEFAWTPDGLCASAQHNVIYWTSVSGWSTYLVYKYDIDKDEFSKYLDFTNADGRNIYGCSFRVDPVTDDALVTLVKGWSNDYIVHRYNAAGERVGEYPMDDTVNNGGKNYWFPGMFVFPDVEDPVAAAMDDVTVAEGKSVEVDLSTVATDADNMQAAIVKSVKKISNKGYVEAVVKNGKLVISGIKAGSSKVTVAFCSNGIETTSVVSVKVESAADGISAVEAGGAPVVVARYTIDGKRISKPQRGLNIVEMSDGTVRKIFVK